MTERCGFALHDDAMARAEALRDAGKLKEAEAEYRTLIAMSPNFAQAHYKLGVVLGLDGRSDEAEFEYRETRRLDRFHPEAANNLGVILRQRQKVQEAKACFLDALADRPDYFEATLSLASVSLGEGRIAEARYYYRRAVALGPENGLALQGLGETLRRSDRFEEALTLLKAATAAAPDNPQAWNSLGSCFLNLSEIEQALQQYRRAVDADPKSMMPRRNIALALNYIPTPKAETYSAHVEVAKAARHLLATQVLPEGFPQSRDPERRLRVGFVSGDFCMHSVSYFMLGVMQALDHRNFEYHAYYTSQSGDLRTREFMQMFHHWHHVHGMPVGRIAQQIRNHRIDILIDLTGYTNQSITEAFVLRPAPVQVSWIGYPNTSGMSEMDYRLTDAWADPEGCDDEFYSERRIRLPSSFLAYTPYEKSPPVAPPPALKNGFITFGSFNQRTKMSADCVALWARVLHAVPGSHLLLKSMSGMGQESVRASLIAEFHAHGVDSSRLELLPSDPTTEAHLSRYGQMDIALDSIPYNGTTTTCEALWMGVPVIGLAGDRHASRVGVSILNNVGLPDLLAQDEDAFVEIATGLAADPMRLGSLREGMRARLQASPLLDNRAMARNLERTWRTMWQDFCARDPIPVQLERPTDAPLQRLDIGGIELHEGWTRVDIEPGDGVDVTADIRDLNMFETESCVEVYCSHVLQCLPSGDVLDALQEVYRVLAPGGRLYLAVPDLDVLSGMLASEQLGEAAKFGVMRLLFGQQQHDNDFYRTGINFDFLVAYLSDIGFEGAEHVESFGLFNDSSEQRVDGMLVSLNLIVTK
jgi:predicted O-linked N-acetylglucosamine transferase (SPINDLY family)/predicted SAM-dependent methyltransferase